jgi:MFS family permease
MTTSIALKRKNAEISITLEASPIRRDWKLAVASSRLSLVRGTELLTLPAGCPIVVTCNQYRLLLPPRLRCGGTSCFGLRLDGSMKQAAIWALGAAQCIFWGVLYYSFSVLMVPMRADLQASDAVLAGAFSAGLVACALMTAPCGRWLDLGYGRTLLRGGALCAAALLVAWSWVETPAGLYLVWIGLGATMAAVLYETAFGLITRAIANSRERLRALASITIMGGLASTLFLPTAAGAVGLLGWRDTLWLLAAAVLLAAWVLEALAFPSLRASLREGSETFPRPSSGAVPLRSILALGAPFVAATFAAMALTTLVIPALVDRGHPLAAASWILAALGIMQLPGRLWLWRGVPSPRSLLVAPLALQAIGLGILGIQPQPITALVGVALFGMGAGLHTLARPWAVPLLFGVESAGNVNGAIARMQGMARAAGPFAAAAAYGRFGSGPVFLSLAGILLLASPLALKTAAHAGLAPAPASPSRTADVGPPP